MNLIVYTTIHLKGVTFLLDPAKYVHTFIDYICSIYSHIYNNGNS